MTHPTIGNLAPTFSLLDQTGSPQSLKAFRGKRNVVVYFYPKAMTPGCTLQACALRDQAKALAARHTVVLGISPDSVQRLAKFTERDGLNFILLSDEDHAIADKYGAWGSKKFMGKVYDGILRTTYIVNKEGRLVAVMDSFKTKTHHEDLLTTLDELGLE